MTKDYLAQNVNSDEFEGFANFSCKGPDNKSFIFAELLNKSVVVAKQP